MNTTKLVETDISENSQSTVLRLPDGTHLPLPPRSRWKGDAHAVAYLVESGNGKKGYMVDLTKVGKKWGKMAAKQALKTGASTGLSSILKLAGMAGARIVGGAVVGILAPSEIATEDVWRAPVGNGINVEVWMYGF